MQFSNADSPILAMDEGRIISANALQFLKVSALRVLIVFGMVTLLKDVLAKAAEPILVRFLPNLKSLRLLPENALSSIEVIY